MATEVVRSIRGTRVNHGRSLRVRWLQAEDIECEPLLFSDLKVGAKFICMPEPGDNSGHGGLLGGAYLFKKIKEVKLRFGYHNAKRLSDKTTHVMSDGMMVLLVL